MKKKNLMKVLSLVLSLSLVSGALTACSSQTEKSETASQESSSESSEAAKEDQQDQYAPDPNKTYEINTYYNFNPPLDDTDELVTRWNEKYNVTFHIKNYDKLEEQLNLDIAAGEIPDVMYCNTNPTMLKNYYDQGALAKIPNEMIDKYMPVVKEKFESEAPGAYEYGYFDGDRYGIPNSIFYYSNYRYPIVYNGLWLQKLGIEKAPETFEELEQLFTSFVKEDPDDNGKNDTYAISNTSLQLVYDAFGTMRDGWLKKDGKYVFAPTQPEMKEALKKLNEWYNNGILTPEFITGENTGGYWAVSHAFLNGQIGVSCMGSGYHWNSELPGRVAGANYAEAEKINPEFAKNFIFGKTITGVDGKKRAFTNNPLRNMYMMFGAQLEKDYGKMAKILQIVDDMMGNEDNYLDAFYGVKGRDWDFAEDGSIAPKLTIEELAKGGAWGTFQFVSLGANNKLPEAALVKWFEETAHVNDSTWQSELYPLTTITESIDYLADLKELWETTEVAIITGEKPIDYFDDFVKEWYEIGGQIYEDEVNKLQK